jgi:hypothetical protein
VDGSRRAFADLDLAGRRELDERVVRARVRAGTKLMLLVGGRLAASAANSVRKPGEAGSVTVRFTDTAFADAGMPQRPAITNVRVDFPASMGAVAAVPTSFRVSRSRHGETV